MPAYQSVDYFPYKAHGDSWAGIWHRELCLPEAVWHLIGMWKSKQTWEGHKKIWVKVTVWMASSQNSWQCERQHGNRQSLNVRVCVCVCVCERERESDRWRVGSDQPEELRAMLVLTKIIGAEIKLSQVGELAKTLWERPCKAATKQTMRLNQQPF